MTTVTFIKQYKTSLCTFQYFVEWLIHTGEDPEFETFTVEKLATLLRRFYVGVRQKNGSQYSKSAYISLRSSLNRHLTSHPHNRMINIMKDREFQAANQVFVGTLKKLRQDGLDKSQHKPSLTPEDHQKLYTSGSIGVENPTQLQRKVFVDLGIHFARRGREGLRGLTKTTYSVLVDSKGAKYVRPTYNEREKNHQGDEKNCVQERQAVMYEIPNDPMCPVNSFELYISKLSKSCEALYTYPVENWKPNMSTWYSNRVMGKNKLGDLMKLLSEKAGTSVTYTNHCLRATSATRLSDAGFNAEEICAVTGHRNTESLKSYIAGPSHQKLKAMSNALSLSVSSSAPTTCSKSIVVECTNPVTTAASTKSTSLTPACPQSSQPLSISASSCLSPAPAPFAPPMPATTFPAGLFVGAHFGDQCNITVNYNVYGAAGTTQQ